MTSVLGPAHLANQEEFRSFVDEHVAPHADSWDAQERIPDELLERMRHLGFWGACVPSRFGGREMDWLSFGLFCEQVGRASASLLSLVTVHTMMTQTLLRWGSPEQQERWLPVLSRGERFGAFALSEPAVGSDAKSVATQATPAPGGYALSGEKKWISFGQRADLFLVFAQVEGKPTAFLVERGTPGFETASLRGMYGFRSAMLAELRFNTCKLPESAVVGRVGGGLTYVAGTALTHGRFCIGWGSTGLSQACVEASLAYARTRRQFGVPLHEHQLIQEMLANMVTSTRASRALCHQAAASREAGHPDSIMDTSVAKYFTARAAVQSAADAVQIHGANGVSADYPVQRYLRDAKILQIIEGSDQIQQGLIARHAVQSAPRPQPPAPKPL